MDLSYSSRLLINHRVTPPAGAGTFEFASEAGKREEAEAGAVAVNVRVLGILLGKEKKLDSEDKAERREREIQKTTNRADRSKSTRTCCGLG